MGVWRPLCATPEVRVRLAFASDVGRTVSIYRSLRRRIHIYGRSNHVIHALALAIRFALLGEGYEQIVWLGSLAVPRERGSRYWTCGCCSLSDGSFS